MRRKVRIVIRHEAARNVLDLNVRGGYIHVYM